MAMIVGFMCLGLWKRFLGHLGRAGDKGDRWWRTFKLIKRVLGGLGSSTLSRFWGF